MKIGSYTITVFLKGTPEKVYVAEADGSEKDAEQHATAVWNDKFCMSDRYLLKLRWADEKKPFMTIG